jgi:hypothetical protein
MKFAIIDAAHLFNRAHHVCSGDAFTKAGMALHIVFNALRKAHRDHGADHIVVAAEGRSWRYDHYPMYKAKRILARKTLSPREQEEQDVFREVLKSLMTFFREKTRMTVLQCSCAEGDDMIARWIQLHPNDDHIIISGDSDNIQLLAPNVSIYDGLTERTITRNGVFDAKGEPLVFHVDPASGKVKAKETIREATKKHNAAQKEELKKVKEAERAAFKAWAEAKKKSDGALTDLLEKTLATARLETLKVENRTNQPFEWEMEEDWPEKALFLKIIRGDVGDGIFSANPGVRYRGSKSSVGIEDAWNDRKEKGFHWNNFMLKRWQKLVETPEGGESIEVKVIDEYEKNRQLIDLTQQPDAVKEAMDAVIVEAVQQPPVSAVGIHFARFCKQHELNRLAVDATDHAAYLGAPYRRN